MVTMIPGGWYRDGQDDLWMDAEQRDNGDWRLYRGGSQGPRDYDASGKFLRQHFKDGTAREDSVPTYDLVLEIVVRRPWSTTVDHLDV